MVLCQTQSNIRQSENFVNSKYTGAVGVSYIKINGPQSTSSLKINLIKRMDKWKEGEKKKSDITMRHRNSVHLVLRYRNVNYHFQMIHHHNISNVFVQNVIPLEHMQKQSTYCEVKLKYTKTCDLLYNILTPSVLPWKMSLSSEVLAHCINNKEVNIPRSLYARLLVFLQITSFCQQTKAIYISHSWEPPLPCITQGHSLTFLVNYTSKTNLQNINKYLGIPLCNTFSRVGAKMIKRDV